MKLLLTLFLPLATLFASSNDPFPSSSRQLAIDAYSTRPSEENWLFSPLSATACLSMAYAGSDQRTASELSNALHLLLPQEEVGASYQSFVQQLLHSPSNEKDFGLHIAQGMWSQINFSFLDSFTHLIRDDFCAEIESIDFTPASVQHINAWFASNTEHKIENLLNPSDIDLNTKLVLANALYFKGFWSHPFYSPETTFSSFTKQNGLIVTASMMHQAAQFPYYEDSECQAVLLPFANDSSAAADPACLLVLNKTASRLTTDRLDRILASLSMRMVDLAVPKFKFEQRLDLKVLLEELGVRDAFTEFADFSKMDGRLDLFISKVVQKCFFSFEENGVEAAAATAAVMNMTSCWTPPELWASFIADRPFEFVLIDQNTKTCLMIGHVEDPM